MRTIEMFKVDALCVAIQEGNEERFGQLLEDESIDWQQLNKHGYSPVHVAIEKGNHRMLEHILQCKGLNVDVKSTNPAKMGWTAFHFAAIRMDHKAILMLNAYGCSPHELTDLQSTPLHLATGRYGLRGKGLSGDVISSLISSEIDPALQNAYGNTPLAEAILWCDEDGLRVMLGDHAAKEQVYRSLFIPNKSGQWPHELALSSALSKECKDTLKQTFFETLFSMSLGQWWKEFHITPDHNSKLQKVLFSMRSAKVTTPHSLTEDAVCGLIPEDQHTSVTRQHLQAMGLLIKYFPKASSSRYMYCCPLAFPDDFPEECNTQLCEYEVFGGRFMMVKGQLKHHILYLLLVHLLEKEGIEPDTVAKIGFTFKLRSSECIVRMARSDNSEEGLLIIAQSPIADYVECLRALENVVGMTQHIYRETTRKECRLGVVSKHDLLLRSTTLHVYSLPEVSRARKCGECYLFHPNSQTKESFSSLLLQIDGENVMFPIRISPVEELPRPEGANVIETDSASATTYTSASLSTHPTSVETVSQDSSPKLSDEFILDLTEGLTLGQIEEVGIRLKVPAAEIDAVKRECTISSNYKLFAFKIIKKWLNNCPGDEPSVLAAAFQKAGLSAFATKVCPAMATDHFSFHPPTPAPWSTGVDRDTCEVCRKAIQDCYPELIQKVDPDLVMPTLVQKGQLQPKEVLHLDTQPVRRSMALIGKVDEKGGKAYCVLVQALQGQAELYQILKNKCQEIEEEMGSSCPHNTFTEATTVYFSGPAHGSQTVSSPNVPADMHSPTNTQSTPDPKAAPNKISPPITQDSHSDPHREGNPTTLTSIRKGCILYMLLISLVAMCIPVAVLLVMNSGRYSPSQAEPPVIYPEYMLATSYREPLVETPPSNSVCSTPAKQSMLLPLTVPKPAEPLANCSTITDVRILIDELQEITEWELLSEDLGVPHFKIDELRRNNPTAQAQKREVWRYWYDNQHHQCWEDVIRTLSQRDQRRKAMELASKYNVNIS